jgi:hypothetical protein
VTEVDDPFAALTDDGTPRGADAVWRAARHGLRRRKIAQAATGAATAAVLNAVVVAVILSRSDHSSVNEPPRITSTTTILVSPALAFDVPWVDRPAPPPYFPAATPTTAPAADARPCTAQDVSIVAAGTNGGGGTDVDYFSVKNVGSTTCRLGDYPPRVVATEPGHPDVIARDGAFFGDPGPAANVAPGRAGALSITTSRNCIIGPTLPPAYHTLLVTLPGGGIVSVHGLFGVSCGLGPSRFGVQQLQPVYPPQWYESVSATMQLPPAVDAGATLTYVVTLNNDTAKAVKIDPCVGYYEHLIGGPAGAKSGLSLNCDTVHRISAHGRVRYQMKLDVPADTPTGPVTVQWTISIPTAKPVTAKATLQVHGNDHPCATDQVTATAPDPAAPFRGSGIYFIKDAGTTLDVTVTNTSSTSCTLQGSPGVRILSARGTDLGLKDVTHGVNFGPPRPPGSRVTLAPGQSATSTLAWHSTWCAANPNPVRVELTLPTNSNVVTVNPTHGWTPPACNGFAWNSVSSEPFR